MPEAFAITAPERRSNAASGGIRSAPQAETPAPTTARFADLLRRGQASTHRVPAPAPEAPDPAVDQSAAANGGQPSANESGDPVVAGSPAAPHAAAKPANAAPTRHPVKAAASKPSMAESGEPAPTEAHATHKTDDADPGTDLPPGAAPPSMLCDHAPAPPRSAAGGDAQADAVGTGTAKIGHAPSDAPGATGTEQAKPGSAPEFEALPPGGRRLERAEPPVALDAAPSPLSGPGGAVPRGFDAGTLAPIALPTPLYAPDFAQALGTQVSVLARDGLQQAELHINPPEMGPISVQIEIDGAQARIDFGADLAATRQVIERGLPELAAALREQGLTLSGGGVFQQARRDADGRQSATGTGRARGRAAEAAPPLRALAAARLPQGSIDLYA